MRKSALTTLAIVFSLLVSSCVNHDIPEPSCEPGAVSFVNDIKPLIEMNCLINNSECHGMNPSIPNWAIFSEVQAKADLIKTRTRNRSMPAIGSLTQAEIDLITCWVNDGAPNN